MNQIAALQLAQMPLIWIVICEIFFFIYALRDKGMEPNLGQSFTRAWPMFRVLVIAVTGAAIGYALGSLISPRIALLGMALGALPGCLEVDRLLCAMRPNTRIWRWFASLCAMLIGGLPLALLILL
jgi:hypothetical protein